jgi:hypothetical protein
MAADDQTLIEEVHEQVTHVYFWSILDDLPPVGSHVRIAGDVAEADFLIGEGGFCTLIASDRMADLMSIPGSFEAIGARDAGQTIRKVLATIPDSILTGPPEARFELLDQSDFDISDAATYFRHEPQALPLLAKYIREHAASFAKFLAET